MVAAYKMFPHLVQESPWPLFTSIGAMGLTGGSVIWWHTGTYWLVYLSMASLIIFSIEWWANVVYEKLEGVHSGLVVRGLRMGMMLFMVSEMMFFFSFFWAFFGNCFNPDTEMGFLWPPVMFDYVVVDPFSIPLLNSVLLLSSGATVTASHHFLMGCDYRLSSMFLLLTLILGWVFLALQVFEYAHSLISVNSTIYGTTFFLLTGFHGFHVTMGAIFLTICLLRNIFKNVSKNNHTGFEAASWYWHFVDVVWLFLYFFVYWYGFVLA